MQGRNFEIPEVVPFRLTQNLVDGFGVMGVEGNPFHHILKHSRQFLCT